MPARFPVFRLLCRFGFLLTLTAAVANGQASTPTQVTDSSALHPPAGARAAIVEFDDLECPACAAANPQLKAAAAQYKIPWVRHDFLIPVHMWSRQAAINARWFDARSKALGDEYRDQVFANQTSIYNAGVLSEFTAKFAQAHGVSLPFSLDPQGKLAAEVEADNALAIKSGMKHTPTVFIVTNNKSEPYIEVLNVSQQLFTDIDRGMAASTPIAAPKAAMKKASAH
jgi:protein-disulfide isomerase